MLALYGPPASATGGSLSPGVFLVEKNHISDWFDNLPSVMFTCQEKTVLKSRPKLHDAVPPLSTFSSISIKSDNNIIYHNSFVDGGKASDCGTNNVWYDVETNEGNFWEDYSGTGEYTIDTYSNSTDPYPLEEPGKPYITETEDPANYPFSLALIAIGLVVIVKKRKKYN